MQRGAFGSTVTTTMKSLTLSLEGLADGYDYSVALPLLIMTDDLGAEATGIGDVVVRAGKNDLFQNDGGFRLDLGVSVKLPTADSAKNLGSGELDGGGFLTLRKQWSGVVTTVSAGYSVIGDPTGLDYSNVTSFGMGLSKPLSRGGVFATADWRSATVADQDDPLELGIGGYYIASTYHLFSASGFVGLSDGSADGGFYLGWLKRY